MFPLLLLQGWYVRRTALRLPDGELPAEGLFDHGESDLQVIGVGDSVIAGTGVRLMTDAITAQSARALAQAGSSKVHWQARGVNGWCLADLIESLQDEPIGRSDIVIVSIGVNDVTALTGLLRWQMQLTALLPLLQQSRAHSIVLLGVPPMEYFTALPQPLRWVLGVRAAMLDKGLQQLASLVQGVYWLDVGMKFDPEHLAVDGYHPNEKAVLEMAEHLVESVLEQNAEKVTQI